MFIASRVQRTMRIIRRLYADYMDYAVFIVNFASKVRCLSLAGSNGARITSIFTGVMQLTEAFTRLRVGVKARARARH